MNLRAEIRPDLWDAISKQYESGLYSNAVLESIHYLSNILRERANIDGDGASLVGQALGSDSPRLRINKFQTETEKNEQKGMEQILRGIYQGIRNPRSHEQFEDSQGVANSIILFVDYILGIISQAKAPFSLEDWVDRVFDPNFVKSDRYAELLVSEVPPKKYMEALINIYRKKDQKNVENLNYVCRELFRVIGDHQLGDFCALVSDELKTEQNDTWIRLNLQLFPSRLWPQLDEISRLRIENKLIRSINDGKYDKDLERISNGALGTWARGYLVHFTLKQEVVDVLLNKLGHEEQESQNYVVMYFFGVLSNLLPTTVANSKGNKTFEKIKMKNYVSSITKAVLASSETSLLRDRILLYISDFPDDWKEAIVEELKPFQERDNAYYKRLIEAKDSFDIPF